MPTCVSTSLPASAYGGQYTYTICMPTTAGPWAAAPPARGHKSSGITPEAHDAVALGPQHPYIAAASTCAASTPFPTHATYRLRADCRALARSSASSGSDGTSLSLPAPPPPSSSSRRAFFSFLCLSFLCFFFSFFSFFSDLRLRSRPPPSLHWQGWRRISVVRSAW